MLYTSAAEGYASEIVKEIDPAGTRFLRVLTRQHCHPLQVGSYAKDLAGLGRPLERTVLVDDSNNSFMMQPDNGIPITAYFGNPTDRGRRGNYSIHSSTDGGLVWQSLSDVFGGGAAYSDLSMTRHGDVGFVFERGPNDRDPYAWLTFGKVAGIPSGGSSSTVAE